MIQHSHSRQAFWQLRRVAEGLSERFRNHVMGAGDEELIRMDRETTGQTLARLWPGDVQEFRNALDRWVCSNSGPEARVVGPDKEKMLREWRRLLN